MIELRSVHKRFDSLVVLDGLDLTIPEGKNFVLMGRSGTGKSVTLQHVIGILDPDRGEVLVDGQSVPDLDRKGLQQLRKNMGYLFQNGALINWLTVHENVALPLKETGDCARSEVDDRVHELLSLVGMSQAAHKRPGQISGGMKLRTGLARALITEPRYVLYDEPNAGLDPILSMSIHRLIAEVRDRLGVTGLVVTHSRQCACDTGDQIGVLDKGRLVAQGTVEEMQNSDIPLVRDFLSGHAD
ncbi:MAG: ATP-binding cassette domain-containing protein [Planctomycetota bacterium]